VTVIWSCEDLRSAVGRSAFILGWEGRKTEKPGEGSDLRRTKTPKTARKGVYGDLTPHCAMSSERRLGGSR
jgi:hypothetical protein